MSQDQPTTESPESTEPEATLTTEDVDARLPEITEFLEAVVEDRGLLAHLDKETRERFLMAAGQVSRPTRRERKKLARASRKLKKEQRREEREEVLDLTGIRRLRAKEVFRTPHPNRPTEIERLKIDPQRQLTVGEDITCYACKAQYRDVHFFYDQLCPDCAPVHWEKRFATAELEGRVCLLTGGRVKIGFQTGIKMLRAGCHLIVTTRFPRDAAARYAAEEDFEDWKDRLEIHGLDLRHTPSVEAFCAHMNRSLDRLDFIINNACQTVRRPSGWYQHLMDAELLPFDGIEPPQQPLLASYEEFRHSSRALEAREPINALAAATGLSEDSGYADAAAMSQLAVLKEDLGRDLHLFPEGKLDADLQQVDLRGRNSWRLALAEVSTVELLEVQLVNAVAPFVMNARLKPLMLRVPTFDKHIVNVSAMEGQFYRAFKTDKHPHTNMAKAALNMMTRTSAPDYAKDGIHMNSVDTGWVTDEDPRELADKKREEHSFHPPLDIVEGAARIVDPIFDGFKTGEHAWGKFFKDYLPANW